MDFSFISRQRLRIALLALLVGALPLCALAAKKPAKAPAKAPASSVKFIEAPSAEKPAARQQRLRRECRGRPNAGACLGHTR